MESRGTRDPRGNRPKSRTKYPRHMRIAVEPVLLACCAVEAATALSSPVQIEGVNWVLDASARDVTVVVLAGTITTLQRDAIASRIANAPEPRAVVAYGVCASTGGPYWDSDAVVPGWPQAHLVVPGCPPAPTAFWQSVVEAAKVVRNDPR